jgi:CDP-4-dehydro-6-deoxyglucose reductase, E1
VNDTADYVIGDCRRPMQDPKCRVYYGQAVYGSEEIEAAAKVLREQPLRLMDGPAVRRFEVRVAALFGKRHGLMVNSGSSANMLAVAALQLSPGSEVITPALNWGTTISPLVQNGLVPVFVDVEPDTFVIDAAGVERAIGPNTRAIMVPDLVGNIPRWDLLQDIGRRHGLFLIHDSADTIGSRFQNSPTGAFSDITTTSFYASHIITCAGFGGMFCCNDDALLKRATLLRGWGRRSTLSDESEDVEHRFNGWIDGEPYDSKFIFDAPRFNFLPSEVAAAFGLKQLDRLPGLIATRIRHFASLHRFFSSYREVLVLPRLNPDVHSAWLAFPLVLKTEAPFDRISLQQHFERRGIQTRPIFSGNILHHPGFRDMRHRVVPGGYPNADRIMRRGLLLGCHQGLVQADLQYIMQVFADFAENAGLSMSTHAVDCGGDT